MRRSKKDIAADVLEAIEQYPNRAPSTVMSIAGTNYQFLRFLITNELVTVQEAKRNRKSLQRTNKGSEYLQHYRICNKLLPSEN